jgi:hypothetical protein
MSPEDVLNELHIRLVEICKTNDWNIIQTSVLPECKRTFIVWTGENKRATILISGDKSVPVTADVILNSDSINLDRKSMTAAISGKLS